jgi:type VI secretion system protein ImpA
MDLNVLLAARDGEEPSGENLEYDPDFIQLQIAAEPGEEKQVGSEFIAPEDPDFQDVEARALAILERSHDLRAAVILAVAALHTRGLSGFAEAVAYVKGALEQHWDTCHPQLDADDGDDPTMRINTVQGLTDDSTVLAALRKAALTESRSFGRVTLRDIQIATGEIPVMTGDKKKFDQVALAAAFADNGEEATAATLTTIRSAIADVTAIEGIFGRRTPGDGPDLEELRRMLISLSRYVGEHVSGASEAGDEAEATPGAALSDGSGSAMSHGGSGGAMRGAIETAQDARRALDAVIAYFHRYEPSSPVPIILKRAKRLVGADFMTVMKDLAPAGVESVRQIGGLSEDDAG